MGNLAEQCCGDRVKQSKIMDKAYEKERSSKSMSNEKFDDFDSEEKQMWPEVDDDNNEDLRVTAKNIRINSKDIDLFELENVDGDDDDDFNCKNRSGVLTPPGRLS